MTDQPQGISKITVKGFKSLYDETSIEIRPLTILAGANSSGKSSIMQPLLLMKQTLESEYTPNVFLLNGPNVRFTDASQFFRIGKVETDLDISVDVSGLGSLTTSYNFSNERLKISKTEFIASPMNAFKSKTGYVIDRIALSVSMLNEELESQLPIEIHDLRDAIQHISVGGDIYFGIESNRCFLGVGLIFEDGTPAMQGDPLPLAFFPIHSFSRHIQEIIHVSGLRDNPERSYPVASIDGNFKGTFNNYFASIIAHWIYGREKSEKSILSNLVLNLMHLGLSYGISSLERNSEISIQVSPSQKALAVNIADVGLGVSQVLPVLVALIVAEPGQLVYLEQPELHLHPRAQVALARILADAANRGVRVVVETHSSLLLIGIQTLIAEGELKPADTILHWFTRGEDGKTTVNSQIPDENGAYGDWPEDFADVELNAQGAYLDAVARRQLSTEAGD